MSVLNGNHSSFVFQTLDARRISDGEIVHKKVKLRDPTSGVQSKLKMGPPFRKEPYAADSRNHCVPIYKVLAIPDVDDTVLLVMPPSSTLDPYSI
ncbi:hypothetical protein E1B28_000195 [Marasmius oreades]|uniref:Uncharacterized protein n=1 Tax=Marasmius oreades TaxID=181124 RepID=A0A9P7V0U5_9AGAR|nr:uncharacterized protein E1B28_000195 [Marasmius oreades]KAG7098228.1 hypothetical protein E1B28_000195 [Marasmius oreades]